MTVLITIIWVIFCLFLNLKTVFLEINYGKVIVSIDLAFLVISPFVIWKPLFCSFWP